jgi:hypothetical protein
MAIRFRSLDMIRPNLTFKKYFETTHEKPSFFVDFDETLVSTNKNKDFDKNLQELINDPNIKKYLFNHQGQEMVSFLRPYAIEFVNELKKLGNVFILTYGNKDYQLPIKNYFHVPIDDDDVFGPNEFGSVPQYTNSYLIDNLHFHASDIIDKLTAMGHPPEYSDEDHEYVENDRHIKVKPFHADNIHSDNELQKILNFILSLTQKL